MAQILQTDERNGLSSRAATERYLLNLEFGHANIFLFYSLFTLGNYTCHQK